MIRILIIHHSVLKNKTIKKDLLTKYPFLNHEAFHIEIFRHKGRHNYTYTDEFTKLYFDVDTIKPNEIYSYVVKNPKATICWFSSSGSNTKIKHYTMNIGSPITKMEEHNDI